ncbi:MAG TPA: hypothetical protein VK927_11205, partial [Adhaeribacter sp.]|nr:hypothetical protein [Adhaeribacter sp.]
SATDPYAMPVVAKLEVAAGITSSVPVILFLRPGEARLNSLAGNSQGFFSLELKQEDPAGLMQAGESFIKMYDTDKMKALLAQSAGNEKVDTARFLHCRLFDLLIGDWDRHGGQWDWLAFNDENHTVFRPVPKDRDQALAYYKDGIVPWVLSRKFLLRKISSFEGNFEDVEGSLQNGRELDEWLLKDLSENGFVAAAVALQKTIPDEVLEEAVAQYPAVFKDTRRAAVLEILKQRRAKLPEVARQFYRALHREK